MTNSHDLIQVRIGEFITTEDEVGDLYTYIFRRNLLGGGYPIKVNIGVDFNMISDTTKGKLKKVVFDEKAVDKYSIEEVDSGVSSIEEIYLPYGIRHFGCAESCIEELELPFSIDSVKCPIFCKITNLEEIRWQHPFVDVHFEQQVLRGMGFEFED